MTTVKTNLSEHFLYSCWLRSQMDMFDMAFELGANFRIINVQVDATNKSSWHLNARLEFRVFHRWLWRPSLPTLRCSSTFSTSTGTSTGRSQPVCLWRCLFVCRCHCRHFVLCLCMRIGQDTCLLSTKTTEQAFGFVFFVFPIPPIVYISFVLFRSATWCVQRTLSLWSTPSTSTLGSWTSGAL